MSANTCLKQADFSPTPRCKAEFDAPRSPTGSTSSGWSATTGKSGLTCKSTTSTRSRTTSLAGVHAFTVPGVGGGFVSVDSIIAGSTAGGIRVGAIGVQYKSVKDAERDAKNLSKAMTGKCTGNKLECGGCKTVLYFHDAALVNSKMEEGSLRAQLFDGLAQALAPLMDRILCGPDMNTTFEDLAYLRARVFALYPTVEHNPVPEEMTTDNSMVATATAWGMFGALAALAQKKQWTKPAACIQGLGNVGGRLFHLLREDGWTVYGSDVSEAAMNALPEESRLSSDALLEQECDVFAPCAMGGVLTSETIERLNCKVVAGAANLQLPAGLQSKNKMELFSRGIEYYDETLLNSGGVLSAVMAYRKQAFQHQDAYDMGVRNVALMLHEHGVISQYDTDEKRKFYAEVMGDGTDNIHFGLWDGIDLNKEGAYGRASINMTDYMWKEAMRRSAVAPKEAMSYVDLGAGTGAAARHIVERNNEVKAACLNLCPNQNEENRQMVETMGLSTSINVVDGTFDHMPEAWSSKFDGVFSQDAFVHAFSKKTVLEESLRICRGGGFLVVSDLYCGDGADVDAGELQTFAQTNMVNDWLTPDKMVEAAQQAGWVEVEFQDLTSNIKLSFELMLQKVTKVIESGEYNGVNLGLLETYQCNLTRRVEQVSKGIFKWGALLARKPFEVFFTSQPPVRLQSLPPMVKFLPVNQDIANPDVVVVTIKDTVDFEALPSSTRCVVTMSAGLDHIDFDAAEKRGIQVRQAGNDAIISAVADYVASLTVFGLRDGFAQVGVRFPSGGWDLSWKAHGVDVHHATIGIIGMGRIAEQTVQQLQKLTPSDGRASMQRIVYHVPEARRKHTLEQKYGLVWAPLDALLQQSDVVLPLCALNASTTHMLGYAEFAQMKPSAVLINAARGKVVDHDGLTQAMEEQLIRHAILDCTFPEPLPEGHPLFAMSDRVTVLPHFATNTTYVREQLVADVPNQVLSALDAVVTESEHKRAACEAQLRKDLACAHKITRMYNMDELVWNHISARLPEGGFLVTPGEKLFDEIGTEDLVKSSSNITSNIIHEAVYSARPDVGAIVHLHTPASVAISCLEEGFMCLSQDSAYFYDKVAHHEWEGVSDDIGEQARLAKAVAGDCNTLVMYNHGFCTFGRTVAEAWVLAYYFDAACKTQLALLQTGRKIKMPDPKVMAHAAKQSFLPGFAPGESEWAALERLAARRR